MVIQEVDAKKRKLKAAFKASVSEKTGPLLFQVDQGAFISNEKRELMKLEEFKPGQTVSMAYVEKPGAEPVLKILVLERLAGMDLRKVRERKEAQHGISKNASGTNYTIGPKF